MRSRYYIMRHVTSSRVVIAGVTYQDHEDSLTGLTSALIRVTPRTERDINTGPIVM